MWCVTGSIYGVRLPAAGCYVVLSTLMDVCLISALAVTGTLMHPSAWQLIAAVIVSSDVFALLLDLVKQPLTARLGIV
jgi:hypothetical protein